MKIIFFGTPEIAVPVLQKVSENFEVILVVTQPDKPVGRKQIMTPSPVSLEAERLGLETIKPSTLKDEAVAKQIAQENPDLLVVVAYGKIIPAKILSAAKLGAINIHGSILPKYRGASPIHAAILNSESKTGISIMLMDAEMDHGPVLETHEISIDANETYSELSKKISELAAEAIVPAINNFVSGQSKPAEQDHTAATYTKILTKEDGRVNWNESAQQIYNQYRAFVQWPGIWTTWNGQALKVTKCQVAGFEDKQKTPGEVFNKDNHYYVKCGEGLLELGQVQLQGKTSVNANDFVRGHKNFLGSKLV